VAYELHIQRSQPITAEEWMKVIETTDDLKIDGSDWVAINPATKTEIRIPRSPETVALWFPDLEEWIKIFHFRRGLVSFKATDWNNPKSPVREKAFELAQKLNAEIVGDEGEAYTHSRNETNPNSRRKIARRSVA
jgi:hypothetical protein